jgi:aspartyl-tRNA(Asn)/glutamyl-tRNA(Gln) amidotransferase subunit C
MRLNDRELEDLESLAALRLDPQERNALRDHLARILEYVDQLRSIDTEGVDPTCHPAETATPLREDEVRPSLAVDEALEQAPARAGDHFEVPRVLSTDEGGSS